MLDIRLIRDNSKAVEENLLRRGDKDKVRLLYDLIRLDSDRRKAIQDVEKLKHMKNNITKDISELKSKGKPVKAKLKEVKELPNRIKKLDGKLSGLDKKCHSILMTLPNMLHESVPQGKDDSDNAELRRWGQQPKFNFTPKGHMEILQQLDMIDFERAAKVSGAGFYYLKGDAVILDISLQRFALDMLRKRGFVVVEPPLMIKKYVLEAAMDADGFKNSIYSVEGQDLCMIGTSEHSMLGKFAGITFTEDELPKKLFSYSMCFRQEIGSHGIDTKGFFRVHQFTKVEMVVYTIADEDETRRMHDEMLINAEEVLQALKLPYHVLIMCTGDMGAGQRKKYDIETWFPGQGRYRETHSDSYFNDFQARRLNIKYRAKNGETKYVYTINNTVAATPRLLAAIIENYQQVDGSVKIPDVLVPFMGKEVIKREG